MSSSESILSKNGEPPDGPGGQWHSIDVDQARADLTATGPLAAQAVAERLNEYGHNRLPEARRHGPLARLGSQLKNFLIYVLITAAVIAALLGHWVDTTVILLQLLFTYLPLFHQTFASAPLTLGALAFAASAGVVVLVVLELETWLRRRFGK